MDNYTIFTKTAKGLGETLGKTKNLSREQRKILKEIDGKANLGDLAAQLDMDEDKLQAAIAKLLDKDYIREFGSSAPPAVSGGGDTVFGLTMPARIEAANSQLTIGDFFRAMEPPPEEAASLDFRTIRPADVAPIQADIDHAAAQLEQTQRAIEEEALRLTREAEVAAAARQQAAKQAAERAAEKAAQAAQRAAEQAEGQARLQAAEIARKQSEDAARRAAEDAAKEAALRAEQAAMLRARQQAEAEAQAKLASQAKIEAEKKAKAEAEAKARAESEAQAQREAEERAHRLAEEEQQRQLAAQAKTEAQEQARIKAHEAARRAAEELAQRERQAQEKALAKEEARLRVEAAATLAAEEQARREAEAQVRKIAEEEARRLAVEQRRIQAEEQARLAAEQAAIRAAEMRAKQDEQERIRLEAAEAARRRAEESARQKAEEKARKEAETQAKQVAREQAQREAQEKAQQQAQEKEQRAVAAKEAKEAEQQIRRLAKEREQLAAAEAARLQAEEKARIKAEKIAQKQAQREARLVEKSAKRQNKNGHLMLLPANLGNLLRWAALLMIVSLIAGLGLLHIMPFNERLAQLEQLASAQLHQPVKIASLNLALLPYPHWRLQQVAIGAEEQIVVREIAIRAEFDSLFSDSIPIHSVALLAPSINDEGLAWLLFDKSSKPAWQLQSISASDVKWRSQHLQLPTLTAVAELDEDGGWRKIILNATTGSLRLDLQRVEDNLTFDLTASEMVLPLGASWAFDTFNAKGKIMHDALEISQFTGVVYGGTVSGTGVLDWRNGWSLKGAAQAKQIAVPRLLPALLQSGAMDANFRYAMRASDAAKLFLAPRINGSFNLGNGVLSGVDMASMVMGQAGNGQSSFNAMSGEFSLTEGKAQVSRIRVSAGLVSASGDATADDNGKLDGRFAIDLRTASRQANASLILSGSLAAPRFSR